MPYLPSEQTCFCGYFLGLFIVLSGWGNMCQDYLNFAAVRLFVANMLYLIIIRKVQK